MKNIILTITYINRFIMIVTFSLYLTIFFGLYAQIVLGVFQVLASLILLIYFSRLDSKTRRMLWYYYTIVFSFFLVWFLGNHFQSPFTNDLGFWLLILVPMSIAFYFTYIVEKIHTKI